MNGRCYCFSEDGINFDECKSPGPTLRMLSGTTITIVVQNKFENTVQDERDANGTICHNKYCDMDNTYVLYLCYIIYCI